jgi:hypothetical protein
MMRARRATVGIALLASVASGWAFEVATTPTDAAAQITVGGPVSIDGTACGMLGQETSPVRLMSTGPPTTFSLGRQTIETSGFSGRAPAITQQSPDCRLGGPGTHSAPPLRLIASDVRFDIAGATTPLSRGGQRMVTALVTTSHTLSFAYEVVYGTTTVTRGRFSRSVPRATAIDVDGQCPPARFVLRAHSAEPVRFGRVAAINTTVEGRHVVATIDASMTEFRLGLGSTAPRERGVRSAGCD